MNTAEAAAKLDAIKADLRQWMQRRLQHLDEHDAARLVPFARAAPHLPSTPMRAGLAAVAMMGMKGEA